MAKKTAEAEILADAMKRVQGDAEEQQGGDIESPAELKRRAQAEEAKRKRDHEKALAKMPPEAEVCYTPLEEGDKVMTIFHGVKFVANKPVKTRNRELILMASTNPWFTVNGKATKRHEPLPRDEDLELAGGLPAGIKEEQMVELEEVDELE